MTLSNPILPFRIHTHTSNHLITNPTPNSLPLPPTSYPLTSIYLPYSPYITPFPSILIRLSPSASISCGQIISDLRHSVTLVLKNRPICWRLIMLAFEVALEDAMVACLLAEYALSEYSFCVKGDCALPRDFGPLAIGGLIDNSSLSSLPSNFSNSSNSSSPSSSSYDTGGPICANIWTAMLVATGKLAAVLAAGLFHRCWKVPDTRKGYRVLFLMVALGGASTVLLPLSRIVKRGGNPEIAGGMVFASSFFFFFFSTPPKIGFETLLQGMVARLDENVAGKIFGFVGTFITSVGTSAVVRGEG